ncbi:hypothetical protein MD484_g9123, partial [Candolleomyces efflorescens]
MAHVEIFPNSQGINAGDIVNIFPFAGIVHLDKLESRITSAAIHDSAERCDAPKCHKDTRVAVQDDLYDWILNGDPVSESTQQPRKINSLRIRRYFECLLLLCLLVSHSDQHGYALPAG